MDKTSVLMQVCNENVYRSNPFHVLGLPSNATPKQIRRRKEDLESARELGEQNWINEFTHYLCKEGTPTEAKVNEAFEVLEDPAKRIVAEFFWFWPIEDSDEAMADILGGRHTVAISKWSNAALSFGRKRAIAQHNLAVIYQLLAIEGENKMLEGSSSIKLDTEGYWCKSFDYWEELADEDDFWSIFEQRMREFDDPRLTGGFVRRIREEFPVAFDNINARFALRYALKDDVVEAQRHVHYMKKTMSGIDDVEQSFETLFEPLERKIVSGIKGCDELLAKDSANGAQCAEQLLTLSNDIVTAANYLLDADNPLRCRILEGIFQACNNYLVAFGNQTKKWKECLDLNERLKPLACTDALRKRVEENGKILEGNVEDAIDETICFSCGKRNGEKRLFGGVVTISKKAVALYGNIQRNYESFGGVRFSKHDIEVPCCEKCSVISNDKLYKFPPIAKAMQAGFFIGSAPTDSQMRQAWGLPAQKVALPQRSVWHLQKP